MLEVDERKYSPPYYSAKRWRQRQVAVEVVRDHLEQLKRMRPDGVGRILERIRSYDPGLAEAMAVEMMRAGIQLPTQAA